MTGAAYRVFIPHRHRVHPPSFIVIIITHRRPLDRAATIVQRAIDRPFATSRSQRVPRLRSTSIERNTNHMYLHSHARSRVRLRRLASSFAPCDRSRTRPRLARRSEVHAQNAARSRERTSPTSHSSSHAHVSRVDIARKGIIIAIASIDRDRSRARVTRELETRPARSRRRSSSVRVARASSRRTSTANELRKRK